MSNSNTSLEYQCAGCGKHEQRDLLVAKKVMFQEVGLNPRTLRSRTVGWYCPQCVAKDVDWNRPRHQRYSQPTGVTNQR